MSMHARRLACFLLGIWLAAGLVLAWVAGENLHQVDRLLSRADPAATLRFAPLGENARPIMRFQASETNRELFATWENVQLFYGTMVFGLILFGSRENKYVLGGILVLMALVVAQRFILTPELVHLGRLIDFVPATAPSAERNQFWVVHKAYVAVEAVKWMLLLALTGGMVFSRKRSGRSRDSRRNLDGVNKPDYRRVDR
jgi:hypothetical protein